MKRIFIYTLLLLSSRLFAQVNAPEEICPLPIGSEIPAIMVTQLDSTSIPLSELTKDNTILIFYRGGWCPYCKKHLAGIQEAQSEIQTLGYKIVGITPDHIAQIPKTANKKDLSYQIVSDNDLSASKAFGIAFHMDEKTIKRYQQLGLNLEEWQQNSESTVLPVPAVFIIKDGIIEFSYVNPDYKTRLEAKTIISLLKSLE